MSSKIDLSHLPPTLLLPKSLDAIQFVSLRKRLKSYSVPLVTKPALATVFLCDTEQKRRANLELRGVGLWTEEAPLAISIDSSAAEPSFNKDVNGTLNIPTTKELLGRVVTVVKLEWFTKVVEKGEEEVPWQEHAVYTGRIIPTPTEHSSRAEKLRVTNVAPVLPSGRFSTGGGDSQASMASIASSSSSTKRTRESSPITEAENRLRRREILERALEDAAAATATASNTNDTREARDHKGTWRGRRDANANPPGKAHFPPMLATQTTEEFEEEHEADLHRPKTPEWVREKKLYACERRTPSNPPVENVPFLDALRKIQLNRILTSDEIGVRAYSTAIASIAAYPYPITTVKQIQSLPGCEKKIAALWYEYHHTENGGTLTAVKEIEESEYYRTLEFFWNIWGVGAKTARHFWLKGWRDLDDIVEHGWNGLTRVQQIGVKYYDEFLITIPRKEVEHMRDLIVEQARRLLPGAEGCVVGGYRRGKPQSGDVDILISHPEVSKSHAVEELLYPLVDVLESLGLVTHVLVIHSPSHHVSSEQGEIFPKNSHHNFDGIPKALLVWQSPFPGLDEGEKNPNPHRRLDILFPPPRALGSTVLSWSGATTFERDIRRYVKHRYGWKFSSEGLTDRSTGKRVPIHGEGENKFVGFEVGKEPKQLEYEHDGSEGENEGGKFKVERDDVGEWVGWRVEEKKVFELIDLEYREPWERWTN